MNIRYALTLAALLAVPAAWADGAPMDGMMAQEPIDNPQVQQDLKLTDAQKQQLKAIHDDAKAKHDAIRKETQDKVSKVLTPEQNKALAERREQHMDRKMDRMEKRMDRMKERQQEQQKQ